MSKQILHIEVGAVYAGSTAVLQNHLRLTDPEKWEHTIIFRSAQAREEFGKKLRAEDPQKVHIAPELEEDILGKGQGHRYGQPLYGGKKTTAVGRKASRLRTLAGLAKYYVRTVRPEAKKWAGWLRGRDFDLVQLHNGPLGQAQAMMGVQAAGLPLTARLQSFIPASPLDKLFLKRPLQYIAVADAIKYYYVQQGIPEDRITTCHEGLVEEEFRMPPGYETVKAELGLAPGEQLVGLVGRLVWWKGHDYFIEAAAEVAKSVDGVKFVIVGGPDDTEPEYEHHLKRKVHELGLDGKVIFTGYRGDVLRYSAALDVAVLASCLPEPGGRSILEALAMGRPCIVTDAGGMPEYVGRDGSAGLLVPIQDSSAMAQAMVTLLKDRDLAQAIGRAAHERMYKGFHMRQTVAGIEAVWDKVFLQLAR